MFRGQSQCSQSLWLLKGIIIILAALRKLSSAGAVFDCNTRDMLRLSTNQLTLVEFAGVHNVSLLWRHKCIFLSMDEITVNTTSKICMLPNATSAVSISLYFSDIQFVMFWIVLLRYSIFCMLNIFHSFSVSLY